MDSLDPAQPGVSDEARIWHGWQKQCWFVRDGSPEPDAPEGWEAAPSPAGVWRLDHGLMLQGQDAEFRVRWLKPV